MVGIVGVGAFSVEGGWVMLFLLLPVFFTWACWMLGFGWLLLQLQLLVVDVVGGFSCVGGCVLLLVGIVGVLGWLGDVVSGVACIFSWA